MLSLKEIKKLQEYLATKPVARAFIFRSFAHNEELPESDIDILVEIDQQVRMGLIKFANMNRH